MAPELAGLIEAGRELAPEDGFELAHQMLLSVDEPYDEAADRVGGAWDDELRSRVDEIEGGRVDLVDGCDTITIAREQSSNAVRRCSLESEPWHEVPVARKESRVRTYEDRTEGTFA